MLVVKWLILCLVCIPLIEGQKGKTGKNKKPTKKPGGGKKPSSKVPNSRPPSGKGRPMSKSCTKDYPDHHILCKIKETWRLVSLYTNRALNISIIFL